MAYLTQKKYRPGLESMAKTVLRLYSLSQTKQTTHPEEWIAVCGLLATVAWAAHYLWAGTPGG